MDTTRISVANSNILDAVSVSAVEWGLIGRRLLSVMSGGETPIRPWIESQISSAPTPSTTTYVKSESIETREGSGEDGRERRKLKNEDSSYDSDFDPCESSTSPRGDEAHEDVSRTASETLGAEFEDYITQTPNRPAYTVLTSTSSSIRTTTAQPNVISAPPALTVTEATPQSIGTLAAFPFVPISASSTTHPVVIPRSVVVAPPEDEAPAHSLASVIESADYPQQVEFGVKLGYSESLVQLALTKLGVNPDKNELLDELIRLGAGAPRSDCEEESQEGDDTEQSPLRQIIIDGSNVAMSHGNKIKFSCKGIRLCVDWFRARGHKEILVFVPMWRKEQSRLDSIITDQDVLQDLEKEGVLAFTPSRSCGGKRIVSYDDRYIIKEALKSDGVIVSNDNYRDLLNESTSFRKVVESSLLMYSWVNGRFEPPDDPLGRNGPSLDVFLRKLAAGSSVVKDSRPCPYGRKCTYGNKCKYMHPERGAAPVKSVTELLQEQKQKHYQDKAKSRDSSPGENLRAKSLSFPVTSSDSSGVKKPLARTQSTFPAISVSQTTAGMKETSTTDYVNRLPTCSSDSSCSSVLSSVTPQESLNTLCSSLMKGDSSHFTLCPQLGFGWQSQESPQGNQPQKNPMQFSPHVGESDTGENMHMKLARQLSINPVGDDRLSKLSTYKSAHPGELTNYMSPISMQHQQQQKQQLLHQQLLQPPPQKTMTQQQPPSHRLLEAESLSNRSCIGTRCISPGPAYSHAYGSREMMQTYLHPQLTRHSSSQESKLSPYSQHILPPCFHNPVGRNLSAPDQIRGGGQQHHQNIIPHITRVNSTSDSRLNLHGSSNDPQHFMADCFDDSYLGRMSCSQLPLSAMNSNSPGPVGSRPLSPQQPHTGIISSAGSRMSQHLTQSGSLGRQHQLVSSNTHEDERLKIFYHLSQLFPEAQVRGALARNPDETDPRKICMSILSMSGCRSVSPSQQQMAGSSPTSVQGISLRGSSPFVTSLPSPQSVDASRETARMGAYSKLTQLFTEEQVRSLLLRFPEETDAQKLCMLLMAEISQS